MRILSWVQSKLNGRQGKRLEVSPSSSHYASKQNTCREEFKDWPQAFLSIGTIGNNELQKDSQISQFFPEIQELSQDSTYLSIEEEVIKLQKEIIELLNFELNSSAEICQRGDESLNESLSSSSCLQADNSSSLKICRGSTDESDLNRFKRLLADKRNGINQRSVSFHFKKILKGRSGLSMPSLKDPIPESKMEKILRKIIQKMIHPQTVPRAPAMKQFLRDKDEEKLKIEDGCKWVKTDSDYIVLEI